MAINKHFLSIKFIFHFSLSLWAIAMSLSGCHQTSKNIRPAKTVINGKVTLLWNEIPGAASYNVYMSDSPGVTKTSGDKITNVTNPVKITQLKPGKTYYFVVTVVNGSGESKESKELLYTAVADKIGLIYWKNLSDSDSPAANPLNGGQTPEYDAVISDDVQSITNIQKEKSTGKGDQKAGTPENRSKPDYVIYFNSNTNELSKDAMEKLKLIAELIINGPVAKVNLNGFSDSTESSSFNKLVSESRANTAKVYLIGKGVKPSLIKASGHGAQKSIASNKSAEGRRLNRRVEIELIIP
jgi:outer membrane protein OmpA-like peptidoglycan-associated protein